MSDDLSTPTPANEWHVKHDGICSRCGITLRTGDVAVYERPTRSIRCVVCPSVSDDPTVEPTFDSGVAGGSARREYERRKATREARIRGRFGRFGGAVLALTDEPQSTRAWATGARGEEKLAKALEGIEGLLVLHDRRVPGTRGNIDHILVAPAGVFVVDAKHYQGRIEIRNRGWFLRPDPGLFVGRRDCSIKAAALGWQVEAVTTALTAAGVDPLPLVTPVLCFIDADWPLLSRPRTFGDVRLEDHSSIRKMASAPRFLDPSTIERLARLLASALPAK